MSAGVDAAFHHVREETGLKIWRIEAFSVVPVPEEQYGRFFKGDSYIVFAAFEKNHVIESHIHFWLGSETSQDEMGVACRKAIELDMHLGDRPVQHREVEGHESELFLSHFRHRGGIEYLSGGVASGFAHVEPDVYEPRLLHVKGRRNVRTQQVPLQCSSLNEGDVFVLDLGLQIFLWTGSSASRQEMAKGMEVMTRLYNARGARPERVVMSDDPDNEAFWGALDGSRADIRTAEEGGDDGDVKSAAAALFRVSNASGELTVEEVPLVDGRLLREMLDENDVFVVDSGTNVYAWVGRGANAEEKASALSTAQSYIERTGKPSWVSATVIRQFSEPAEFKSLFFQWDPPRTFDFTVKSTGNIARGLPAEAIDFKKLHEASAESEEGVEDHGTGRVRVFRIQGFEMAPVDEASVGEFFAGDSYVIHYHYVGDDRKEHDIIYFWLGRLSEVAEKGTAAARTKELADSLGGHAPHVRITQGKEPPHFSALFKGAMIVHMGGMQGVFEDDGSVRLYHCKGTRPNTTKAVQVDATASNLNSGDCFIVATSDRVAIWNGRGSSGEEQDVARRAAERLAAGRKEVVVFAEGEEDDAFWEALGGKTEYPDSVPPPGAPTFPRLFHVSDATGTLRMEEIFNFSQDDLQEDDVMILDTTNQIFVWIGPKASEREKANATRLAEEYLRAATDGRDQEVPILTQYAGFESKLFTCNFTGWSQERARSFADPYAAKLHKLQAEEAERKARVAAEYKDRSGAIAALEETIAHHHDEAASAEKHAPEAWKTKHHVEPGSASGGGGGGGGSGGDGHHFPSGAAPPITLGGSAGPGGRPAVTGTKVAAARGTVDEEEAARQAAAVRAAKDDSELRQRLEAAERARQEELARLSGGAQRSAEIQPGDRDFSIEELRAANRDVGPNIDFSKKEQYLSDADFRAVMGCTKAEFDALPKWKQVNKKKETGLF